MMVPVLVSPNVAARAEARDVLGFVGVTQSRKGRTAARAAKKVDGRFNGSWVMNGLNSEGEDSCGDLDAVNLLIL